MDIEVAALVDMKCLLAPVGDLELIADTVHDQAGSNGSLLPDPVRRASR